MKLKEYEEDLFNVFVAFEKKSVRRSFFKKIIKEIYGEGREQGRRDTIKELLNSKYKKLYNANTILLLLKLKEKYRKSQVSATENKNG